MIPLLLPATKSSKRASDDWTHAGFRQGLDNHPLRRDIQILEGARIRRDHYLNPVKGEFSCITGQRILMLATKDCIPILVRENPSRYGGGCSAVDLRLTFGQDRILFCKELKSLRRSSG